MDTKSALIVLLTNAPHPVLDAMLSRRSTAFARTAWWQKEEYFGAGELSRSSLPAGVYQRGNLATML